MGIIAGRSDELKILEKIYKSKDAELLAIYGRRRVGKTHLISNFFKEKGIYFELTGTKDAKAREQLVNFSNEFSRVFLKGDRKASPENWTEAFVQLEDEIEKINRDRKIILFFDEMPWLNSKKSGFLQALDHFWNRHASRDRRVIAIVCGSAASWMIKNVIYGKGGLHNRITKKIRLLPFTLTEVEEFLKFRNIDLDRKQIIELYMAMGGIAQYLKYAERGKSAAQIINDTCFCKDGELFGEFERLYRSLFDSYENHVDIIRALAKAGQGLIKNELLKMTGLKSGGASSKTIKELEEAGFIVYVPAFNKRKASGRYRLIDQYSLFYLTWIEKANLTSLAGTNEDYWTKKRSSKGWDTWAGYAFENICFKHLAKIKSALGISGVSTIESGWSYIPPKGSKDDGAQIDMIIDRADNCINLCEMKYHDTEFAIDKECARNLKNKKIVFKEKTGTKKTLFTTMITTYGVKENEHYLSVIDNQLTMNDLF